MSKKPTFKTLDGNEAAASIAYRCNQVIGIYPITPSSPMSEACEVWESQQKTNLWGQVPRVIEMQSEGGAAGAVHGALMAGSMATTFTSSQGLLLKIPNMYKIAGELTPFVMHVAARTIATHALSIFGDHSDVMAVRQTGFAMLAANSVQQAHDMAMIAQAATLDSRVPFVHFFDGFRTSHEINKIAMIDDDTITAMINQDAVEALRQRGLTPDAPSIRGTAQNPDTFFQSREAANPFYLACPDTVADTMAKFGSLTGREYKLFDYYGHPEAENIIIVMGSATSTVQQAVDQQLKAGHKVGVLNVHLFRPFSLKHFLQVLPASVKNIAVLDRTKEPGALGEPLYLDVVASLAQAVTEQKISQMPTVMGGRYGLSSKEFTPSHVEAIFNAMAHRQLHHNFTVGITDDITHLSLPIGDSHYTEPQTRLRALFYGLGADGTVSANKNTIKIIGENTDLHTQGYFVYDSKKSGGTTVSHLRIDSKPIEAPYLIDQAEFVACHQFQFIDKLEMVERAAPNGTVLLNSPHDASQVWQYLPREVQQTIINKQLTLYVIDAVSLARELGLKNRINTIMQAGFFALSEMLPTEQALAKLNQAIEQSYSKRGPAIVEANQKAVAATLERIEQVAIPDTATSIFARPPIVSERAPDLVKHVSAMMMADKGDLLPVSAFPVDGTWPTATSQWEKRNIAQEIPVWESDLCTQCNICTLVCPHAAIRAKAVDEQALTKAPYSFESVEYKQRDFKGKQYTLQVSPQDCTGCNLCTMACPASDKDNPARKAINMQPKVDHIEQQSEHFAFFTELPELERIDIKRIDARSSQLLQPLFEFSGACSGCGETSYIKLLTQLFGDRMLIANATGCSSIYGGNLPTTPYAVDSQGRGPAWANSLFEDNAEFGLGMRLALNSKRDHALILLEQAASILPTELREQISSDAFDSSEAAIRRQRDNIAALKAQLDFSHQALINCADDLVAKSNWIIGGDGWAYDIDFGGLDHVLAGSDNVNVLVMDTQGYSNTGGQQSKATPTGAVAKFATQGKASNGKDLAVNIMMHGNVYVAKIALGANMNQAVKALQEAEAYPGPSLVIAYSPCITHGFDMAEGVEHQQLLVESGLWPLFRFDPRRTEKGRAALQMDSKAPNRDVEELISREARFTQIQRRDPERYQQNLERLRQQVSHKHQLLNQLLEWK
ncbi:pyruvate:ferredoxin (flavodoxin) oxidoreductase [Photobacterium jeanii]|uniref:Pyruvate-flavodoxin oxidoreductase n=1 Tax=Photobacterium jeanii TaxID=858640 RepID=A0A178K8H6_9GAMM|nr:pyruvate:ferredoxin (flavodoxin) oxidoreductase [Photobacterium jeanii]OAN13621.1 pyruvate:ferredoxin (flavodoxin) oxidoreductase [Photobacterium jeanii]PST88740.1 pyruvate:ferredoxin (flavodoxin) oxidoreductase [Photobacterium jeanii]